MWCKGAFNKTLIAQSKVSNDKLKILGQDNFSNNIKYLSVVEQFLLVSGRQKSQQEMYGKGFLMNFALIKLSIFSEQMFFN